MADAAKPWAKPMPDAQFQLMHDILAAPSPIGLEGAMTHGVLKPYFESIAPAVGRYRPFAGMPAWYSIPIPGAMTCSRSW